MRAAIFQEKYQIDVKEVPDPVIQKNTDAIVKVVMACVCGSDLWYYRGIAEHQQGPIGHEFIGIVEEVGSEVALFAKGDFVISPFAFSDNTCPHCRVGFHTACVNGSFFGMGENNDGGQAEFVRVPFADGTLVKAEGSDFSDDMLASFLTLSDVMSTGYHAAVSANVKKGGNAVIVGDGAVGLSAVLSAKLLGAEQIIIISRHETRQRLAREWGATHIVEERGEAGVKVVRAITAAVGADAVMECVGTKESNEMAFAMARPGAVVGRVGVPHEVVINPNVTFFYNVGMRGGPAPARAYIPNLLGEVIKGKINPGKVFDFVTDLDNVSEAYAAMDERRAIKSLIKVS